MSRKNRNSNNEASEVKVLVPVEQVEGEAPELREATSEEVAELTGEQPAADTLTLAEARAEETAEVVAEAAAGKRGKKKDLNLDDPFLKQTITLVRKENPKRKGSKSAARYNLYKDGQTVAEFLKAGGTRGDVNWDSQHEHIKLTPAAKS